MLSSILILRSYPTCGVGYGRERSALVSPHRSLSRYTEFTFFLY
ncbi:hypothetical protein LEP1GSC081_4145 [Leptospira kirschneri str. H1]|uniref:Uncharacterized protein n=1 Tax=Leptospira kirschneri str. H1 TaxID=1049966 RepID=A0A0E2B4B5_9LEPT|nr:hypothetical protein LEP1GSC081_4145 [Leptospira kirschneri str. H1]